MGNFKYMFKHKPSMVSKTITVTEEAYKAIARLKQKDESFSKLFLRLSAKKTPDLRKFVGILKGDAEKAKKEAKKIRDQMSKDVERRSKRVRP
jgi:predicted CopG family antitoxin